MDIETVLRRFEGGRSREESMSATGMSPGPQHLQALQRANAVRLARAELKRRVAVGEITAAEVIDDCPWEAESMTVSDLLTSQHRWGHTRCRRLLQSVPISENKTIASMTERQRRALVLLLEEACTSAQPPRRREALSHALAGVV
jgi:hypothetical protein